MIHRLPIAHDYDQFIWASNQQAKMRALSLTVIRTIVAKYKGIVTVDEDTGTLYIEVPKGKDAECGRELEEQVGSMVY